MRVNHLLGLLIAVVLWASPDLVMAQADAEQLVASVRKSIQNGRLAVEPHVFRANGGMLMGGAKRAIADYNQQSPMSVVVNTVCLIEVGTAKLPANKKRQLFDGCRAQIMDAVKQELEIIASEATDDKKAEKLSEQFEQAKMAFEKSAERIGYRPIFEGDKRWDVNFQTVPDGGSIFLMNAGDYDVYLWCQKNKVGKSTPDWITSFGQESFGDGCEYYAYAKWDDKVKSEVKLYTITGKRTIVIRKP